MNDDHPRLLVIGHDNNCTICHNGRCNCDTEMVVLVGDLELPKLKEEIEL